MDTGRHGPQHQHHHRHGMGKDPTRTIQSEGRSLQERTQTRKPLTARTEGILQCVVEQIQRLPCDFNKDETLIAGVSCSTQTLRHGLKSSRLKMQSPVTDTLHNKQR